MDKIELKNWVIANYDRKLHYRISKDMKIIIINATNYLKGNSTLGRRCWHIIEDTDITPKCKSCLINDVTFNRKINEYHVYCCGRCANNDSYVRDKIKETNLVKYGGVSPIHSEIIKNKIKKTSFEKYGVESASQSCYAIEKRKTTCLEKYGVENPLQSEIIRNKIKETNLEKYGFECTLRNEEVDKKRKNTNMSNYGVENPFSSLEIQSNIKKTNLEKYGVDNPMKNNTIVKKGQKTTLEKYGVEVHNGFKYKNYILPSGRVVKIQGYEDFALNHLLTLYGEDDIVVGCEMRKYTGKIEYLTKDNKTHVYYPDIYIISENKIIEVKCGWTYNKNNKIEDFDNINLLKREAVINLGINFIFYVIDRKGKINFLD